jgi:membrane protein insertase Oxa1/YidC/SpoIIIJ
MILAFLIALIILTGILGAYAMNFQKTTLILGKRLAPDNPLLRTGFQDAITPKIQTARNIIWPILDIVIFVYGLVFYKWYWGIGFAALTFIIVIPIFRIILPKAGSNIYKNKIEKELTKRLAQYKKCGDEQRETAMSEVINRFNNLI